MAVITLEGVTKSFPDGTVAVNDLHLHMADGEFVVLVGPSGSGKSTVLRMIAGLEEVTSGAIRIGDRVVNDVSPAERDIAMVFQSYALYPHMTVFDNMAFALKLRAVPKDEIQRRVRDAAELLSITEYLGRKPRHLSGGQRQRVAMGRAIVREPAAFLMDEPLSNLDAKLRVQMRSEIGRLHQRLGTSTVYVTHDQVEAVTMADRVAVLKDGELQQFGTPEELYEEPVNVFVAGFIGSPAMNIVSAHVVPEGNSVAVSFGSHRLELPPATATSLARRVGKHVILGIRPEDMEDPGFAAFERDGAQLEVDIELVENLGAEKVTHFEVDATPLWIEDDGDVADAQRVARPDRATFTARLHPRSLVSAGQTTKLAIDLSRLYFFDPGTGEAIR
ncbi:MAG: sn-glycerol-3-phosphate ABC transporter ATP-binding protein UgpC [Actinomycetota bacterium]|nr:sn-glycerol-3-phosphate ABC transporter ATP-binding protein UgpC [Actinomycetota bacterium]